MSEVPEHLLERSRLARERMTGVAGDAPAAASSAAVAAAPAAAAPAAAAAPVPITIAEPDPLSPMAEVAMARSVIPFWVVPVLVFLPIWGLLYVGTLERQPQENPVLSAGGEVYASCQGCHGANGQGGQGQVLNGGSVVATFPSFEAQMWWIANGSPDPGTPFGNPDREGGQRESYAYSGAAMPAQALDPVALIEVTYYERIEHGEQDPTELDWVVEWVESGEVPDSFEIPAVEADAVDYLHTFTSAFLEEGEGGEEQAAE